MDFEIEKNGKFVWLLTIFYDSSFKIDNKNKKDIFNVFLKFSKVKLLAKKKEQINEWKNKEEKLR